MLNLDKIIQENINKFLETQLLIIKEDHRQLTIPFDGNPNKYNYEHFIDYLEEIGKYGTLEPCPNFKINKVISDEYLQYLKEYYDASIADTFVSIGTEFLQKYNVDDNDVMELDSMWGNTDCGQEPYDKTCIICQQYNIPIEKLNQYIKNRIFDFACINYNMDENGFIYIERMLTFNNLLQKEIKPQNTLYNKIMNHNTYKKGIGVCWSWKQGGGEAYCGCGEDDIILVGKVRACDVDWETTLFCNLMLSEEMELRLKTNVIVEIDEIRYDDIQGDKLPLHKPILISTGNEENQ